MSDIVEKWLMRRLGFVTKFSPESIAELSKDGRLFAELLYNYGIINYDQFLEVKPAEDAENALNNLHNYIAVWLKLLGIESTHETLLNIAYGKGSAAVRLFYQLYLRFQDKDAVHYIKERVKNECLNPPNLKFEVTEAEEPIGDGCFDFADHPCETALTAKNDVIQWHKERYRLLLENCQKIREQYIQKLHAQCDIGYSENIKEQKNIVNTEKALDVVNLKSTIPEDCGYEKLVEEQNNATQFEPQAEKGEQYVQDLKHKRRIKDKEDAAKVQSQKILLMEMWENLMKEQELQFENAISEKLLKQSTFEKQMATKLFQIRHQKEVIINNKRIADNAIMKQREDDLLDAEFFKEKSITDQKNNYYFERDRVLELHQRLYEKKMQLKAERHENMCKDAVKDIINLAIKHHEFKEKHKREVPPRVSYEWSNLFVKEKPIFRILNTVEDIVQEDLEDLPKETEEIYTIETDRQNALDDKVFEDYCEFNWPFDLDELGLYDDDEVYSMQCGGNILGHIVHRVLLAKYPILKPAFPPNIPPVNTAVCIDDISDVTIIPVLQTLLQDKGIKLIEIQEALNYCLAKYKDETTYEYDNALVDETEQALEDLGVKRGKKKKEAKDTDKKGKKKKGKSGSEKESVMDIPATGNKVCQTPLIFPCEEIILTEAAQLGKKAYEMLNLGEALPDDVTSQIFIEYLKTLKDIKGWVLLNYPVTFQQILALEEALTGRPVITDLTEEPTSIDEVADLGHRRDAFEDKEKALRTSKIVPNPHPPITETYYETYLTAYISIKQDIPETDSVQKFNDLEGTNTTEEFYAKQGCLYTLYYKVFDFATIKHLGKLIIGEYTIPPKASLEIFGDTVLYLEGTSRAGSSKAGKSAKSVKKGEKPKKPKPPKSTPSQDKGGAGDASKSSKSSKGKENKGKKGKKIEVLIVREDKETQIPELEEEEAEEIVEPPPPPKPGEEDWVYLDVALPHEFEVVLASLWENAEDIYSTDLKQLFFTNRVILNTVIPYVSYVLHHLQKIIEKPDLKQVYLHKFQKAYNEIDEDMRDDEEVKAELHCRIVEFREKLWQICDGRMRDAEQERVRIIQENWLPTQICEVANNHINRMELELSRFSDTMQFLTDYYTTCVTKSPKNETVFEKKTLTKLQIGLNYIEVIQYLLREAHSEIQRTPFHDYINDSCAEALSFVKSLSSAANAFLDEIKSTLGPTTDGKASKKAPKKGKKDKTKFWEPTPEVKENAEKILEEWKSALTGEISRVKLRLQLIKAVAEFNFDEVISCAQKTFHEIYDNIKKRYEREVNSIQKACEVLSRAVEAETRLQPQLVLDGDKFFIEPDVILFPEPLIVPDAPLPRTSEETFTLMQLNQLFDVFFDAAPNGSMNERYLTFIIQDMATLDAEDGRDCLVPPLWKQLNPNQVSDVMIQLFGNAEYIEWRDFIVRNLSVPFPSEDELMETRKQFRELDQDATEHIKDYQFDEINFWFEDESCEDIQEIRKLLFRLFRVDEDTLNYTALLLAFCKDTDPVGGVAKALGICLGKYVCWEKDIGEHFLQQVLQRRAVDDKKKAKEDRIHQSNLNAAKEEVCQFADDIVHTCDSLLITDYLSSENMLHMPGILKQKSSTHVTEGNQALEDPEDSGSDLDKFSNVPIGFESTDSPAKIYFLPFDALLTVLTAALPWHSVAQNVDGKSLREHIEGVFEKCAKPEFNGEVAAHEFLNHPDFVCFLNRCCKFTEKDPVEVIKRLLGK